MKLDGVFENIRKEIVFIVVKRRSVKVQAMAAVMMWLASKDVLEADNGVMDEKNGTMDEKNGTKLKFVNGLAIARESGDAAI